MIPVIVLICAVVLFRLIPSGWENFSPMAALVLCGAAFLPRRWAVAAPLAALLLSDLALNLFRYQVPVINPHTASILLAFGLVFLIGWSLRRNPSLPRVFAATMAGSLVFYLVTNTASWLASPAYAKTAAGWLQCVTVGTPGYPPTWIFFRNSLIGDLFFTGLFVALYVILPRFTGSTATARQHEPPALGPTASPR